MNISSCIKKYITRTFMVTIIIISSFIFGMEDVYNRSWDHTNCPRSRTSAKRRCPRTDSNISIRKQYNNELPSIKRPASVMAISTSQKSTSDLAPVICVEKIVDEKSNNFYIPVIAIWQPMDEPDYRMLINTFMSTNFKLKYNKSTGNYHVIFPAKHNVKRFERNKTIEINFREYKKIIQEAYKSICGKSCDEIIIGDPALNLYGYMNYLREASFDNIPDNLCVLQKYKKEVVYAFDTCNLPRLAELLDQEFAQRCAIQ